MVKIPIFDGENMWKPYKTHGFSVRQGTVDAEAGGKAASAAGHDGRLRREATEGSLGVSINGMPLKIDGL